LHFRRISRAWNRSQSSMTLDRSSDFFRNPELWSSSVWSRANVTASNRDRLAIPPPSKTATAEA
jgi:hypothetical protein